MASAPPGVERYPVQKPTVNPDPVREVVLGEQCCGMCPGWKQANPRAPFGQCLPAIRWLGAPMYTPDLAGCSLDPETKAKGAGR